MDGGALIASLVALALANKLLVEAAPAVLRHAAAPASTPLQPEATEPVPAQPRPAATAAASTQPLGDAVSEPTTPARASATPAPTPLPSTSTTPAPPTLRELAVHGVLSALVVCLTAVAGWTVQQALAPLALLHSTAFLVLPLAAAMTALTAFAMTRWRAPLHTAAWPLIAANALAIAVLVPAAATPDLATALLRSFLAGAGFTLALLALAALDARLQPREAPAAFRGLPLSLLNAGLLALAAQGLAGFVT